MSYTKKTKVICIGWHKTGTSTMGHALVQLGYTVLGARSDMAYPLLNGDKETPIKLAENFDALQDVPWANLFKELDKAFPESKFILTVREEKSWLNSATNHFGKYYFAMHEWIYGEGVLVGNEELYLSKFRNHYEEVNEYFNNRPNDLLVMDLAKGDGWEKLCDFLNKPIPKKPFPHANKGQHTLSKKERIIRNLKNIIPVKLRRAGLDLLDKFGLHNRRNLFNNQEANNKERGKIL